MLYIVWHIIFICSTFGDNKINYRAQVISAKIQTLWFSINHSPNGFSNHCWLLPISIISLGIAKWWFSNSIIYPAGISYDSFIKEEFLFSKYLGNLKYISYRKGRKMLTPLPLSIFRVMSWWFILLFCWFSMWFKILPYYFSSLCSTSLSHMVPFLWHPDLISKRNIPLSLTESI